MVISSKKQSAKPALTSRSTRGFALLLSIIISSVVLAIGLVLVNVTLKQLSLSTSARESETAFHMASAGLECARYYRGQESSQAPLASGSTALMPCLGNDNPSTPSDNSSQLSDPTARWYVYDFAFEAEEEYAGFDGHYVEVTMHVVFTGANTENPDYGGAIGVKECQANSACTAIFARGYNRPQADLDSIYAVQRELTADF